MRSCWGCIASADWWISGTWCWCLQPFTWASVSSGHILMCQHGVLNELQIGYLLWCNPFYGLQLNLCSIPWSISSLPSSLSLVFSGILHIFFPQFLLLCGFLLLNIFLQRHQCLGPLGASWTLLCSAANTWIPTLNAHYITSVLIC